MIYTGSIVFIEPQNLEAAEAILKQQEEIDIHTVSEDGTQIVISIETADDGSLDELVKKIKSYDEILDVGHHIMHFEDEVESILSGEKVPDLREFQRSRRREKNPLEIKEA